MAGTALSTSPIDGTRRRHRAFIIVVPRVRTRVNNVKAYRSVSLLSCSATELLTLQERVTRLRQGELDDEGLTCSFVSPSLFHALRGFFDLQHQASPLLTTPLLTTPLLTPSSRVTIRRPLQMLSRQRRTVISWTRIWSFKSGRRCRCYTPCSRRTPRRKTK